MIDLFIFQEAFNDFIIIYIWHQLFKDFIMIASSKWIFALNWLILGFIVLDNFFTLIQNLFDDWRRNQSFLRDLIDVQIIACTDMT